VAADDRVLDPHFIEELTPLPNFGPTVSPLEAELAVARSTCETRRLAMAAMQARIDELEALNKQLHNDRRALAARIKVLEGRLRSSSAS